MSSKTQGNAGNPSNVRTKTIKQPVESYVNSRSLDMANPDFDSELIEMSRQLLHPNSLTGELQRTAEQKVSAICTEINRSMVSSNSAVVTRAFQIGDLLIRLREHMTVIKGKRRSTLKYKKFIRSLTEGYATAMLEDEKKVLSPEAYEIRWNKAEASRRRQLNKCISIAECGEEILVYRYAGIEAVLEIRYLLLDIHHPNKQDGRPKLSTEAARAKLADIIAKWSYPKLEELTDRDIRQEFRLHTDTLGTIYHLISAGFKESDIERHAALAYATEQEMSLVFREAEDLYEKLKDTDPKEMKDRLSMALKTMATEERPGTARPLPEQIADHFSRILEWKKENDNDQVAGYIKSKPEAATQFISIHQYINDLFTLINPQEG